jgi:phosphoribosylformimino-5-aminoimidazole carboxamide ribotide isomerase
MIIIPAIDIINGACVRLTKGDYAQQTTYSANPLDIALNYQNHGFTHLHLVDLDGAKSGGIVNDSVLKNITQNTTLKVDFGGGVKTDKDIELAFAAGANQITGGSIAVKNDVLFTEWIKKYGAEKIILGADVHNEKIAVSGWLETSNVHLFDFLEKYLYLGLRYVICTDIAKDGLLQGSSNDLYKKILQKFPQIQLIASGGVTSEEDLKALQDMNIYGAIVGKAIYENKISLETLKKYHTI